jgi:hypothetical protein
MKADHKRKALVWIALAALAVSCSQLNGIIPSNSSGVMSALLTPEQISVVNLQQQIFQPGDLPADFSAGSPGAAVPERFADFPPAQYQISVEFSTGGSWAGNASVFLYSEAADIEKAFNPKGEAYDESQALEGLGDKSSFLEFSIPYGTGATTLDGANAFWVRCSAVAEIRLVTRNVDDVKNYALALDQRIAPFVCNNGQVPETADSEPAAEMAAGTVAEPAATETAKPSSHCPYQEVTVMATIVSIIEAEATAANNEDLSIIKDIFASNALLRFEVDGTEWHSPIARYQELFESADILNSKHFGIQPTGKGITADTAWFISGSSGTYVPHGGEAQEYYNEVGKDSWVLKRNIYGCWVITEFRFY